MPDFTYWDTLLAYRPIQALPCCCGRLSRRSRGTSGLTTQCWPAKRDIRSPAVPPILASRLRVKRGSPRHQSVREELWMAPPRPPPSPLEILDRIPSLRLNLSLQILSTIHVDGIRMVEDDE